MCVAVGLHDCVCRVDTVQVESRIRSLISMLAEEVDFIPYYTGSLMIKISGTLRILPRSSN